MSPQETTARLLAEIRSLPRRERLRLIERAAHDLAEDDTTEDPSTIIGSMAQHADLLDQITGDAMTSRRQAPLRRAGA